MTSFQLPRTWIYMSDNLNVTHFSVFRQWFSLTRLVGQRLATSLSPTVSLHQSRFTTGGAACLSLARRLVRLTAHVTRQSAAASWSRFLYHVSICTVSENKHLAELLHVCSLLLGWCHPDNMPLHKTVPSYCPVAVIAFF